VSLFAQIEGQEGGSTGVDNEWAQRGMENVGAWILGRNMFGPVRGAWPNESWKGWWGDEAPYHVPVFGLTHYPRKSIEMQGGTTFHFVTDGINSALQPPKTLQTGGTGASAGVLQRFSNTFAQSLSMNCTSHFVRFSWVRAKICSPALTWLRSGRVAPKMLPQNTRCTWP
jgi:hypothetical protein